MPRETFSAALLRAVSLLAVPVLACTAPASTGERSDALTRDSGVGPQAFPGIGLVDSSQETMAAAGGHSEAGVEEEAEAPAVANGGGDEQADSGGAGHWYDGAGPIAGRPRGISGVITATDINMLRGERADEQRYLGIAELDLVSGIVRRFLQGRSAHRWALDGTAYVQSCNGGNHRIALADRWGIPWPLTPCSDDHRYRNPGSSDTRFWQGVPSPNRTYVAVDYFYYKMGWQGGTMVLDGDGDVVADFFEYFSPTWTADGRLLVSGSNRHNGIYMASAASGWRLRRIDGGRLESPVESIAVHPHAPTIAFVFNGSIWEMDLDGNNLRKVVEGSGPLASPAYSPEGRFLAYLQYSGSAPEQRLHIQDLDDSSNVFALNLGHLWSEPTFRRLEGPLSWTSQ